MLLLQSQSGEELLDSWILAPLLPRALALLGPRSPAKQPDMAGARAPGRRQVACRIFSSPELISQG